MDHWGGVFALQLAPPVEQHCDSWVDDWKILKTVPPSRGRTSKRKRSGLQSIPQTSFCRVGRKAVHIDVSRIDYDFVE